MTIREIAAAMLLQGVDIPRPVEFWPNTIAGWIAITLAVVGLGSQLVGFGRMLERLNGYGTRLKIIEEKHESGEGSMSTLSQQVAESGRAITQAMKEVGEAKRMSENCNDNTKTMELTLGAQMHEIVRSIDRLITELRVRGHIDGPPIPKQK